jgi:protein TonB
MAIIVLLHLGFFWALTNGLSHSIGKMFEPAPPVYLPLPVKPTPPPVRDIDVVVEPVKVTHVMPDITIETEDSTNAPLVEQTPTPPATFTDTGDVSPPQPVVMEPRIDPRRGLTEPAYPSSEIRLEHEGTVLLSVYILANGRVGEVKLDKSSGYPKLDESALREARVWRFQPGSRDGTPVAMWKQLPISFRITK